MRPPTDTIVAPPLPDRAEWINSPPLRMHELRGRPVLIEFWDFCRPNSLRTLPYIKAWNGRYADLGLVVIAAHCPGFRASADERNAREAVERLEIAYPVLLDTNFALWQEYENAGWPGRYLWSQDGLLRDYYYGEGGYGETELAIQELVGVEREPLAPLRAEDEPDATLVVPSADRREPPWSGPYEAGGVWAVLEPRRRGRPGSVVANGNAIEVGHAGAFALLEHSQHAQGELVLDLGAATRCDGICFTPGLAV
ncbi:MAG: DipZ protein [Solirubrobacteraceae bacterium]